MTITRYEAGIIVGNLGIVHTEAFLADEDRDLIRRILDAFPDILESMPWLHTAGILEAW